MPWVEGLEGIITDQKSSNWSAQETRSKAANGKKWRRNWKFQEVNMCHFLSQNLMIYSVADIISNNFISKSWIINECMLKIVHPWRYLLGWLPVQLCLITHQYRSYYVSSSYCIHICKHSRHFLWQRQRRIFHFLSTHTLESERPQCLKISKKCLICKP